MTHDPQHVGIILDGNRRFSKRLLKEPWKGHEWGAGKVEKLFDWAQELGIKELTLYSFSMQNFNREKKEFEYLMNLFRKEFKKLIDDDKRLHEKQLRINFIGRIHLFPEDIQESMHKLMDMTKDYSTYIVNFAMAYGGREEITDAVKAIAEEVSAGTLSASDVDEELIGDHLYLNRCPDFIIRTGGDFRTSNFLMWQSHYSEWFFLDKLWPEFEKEDLVSCIEQFKNRERRFGK